MVEDIMKIYDLLKYDHDKVKELLDTLSKKKDLRLFEQLRREIIAHNEAEEEAFYEPLQSKTGRLSIMIDAGHEEHDLAMDMMDELAEIDNEEEWNSLFSVIKKSIEAHIKMEEEDIFQLAQKYLTDKEAEEIARNMTKLKAREKEEA
jgi:hemerythrin superfamily protein